MRKSTKIYTETVNAVISWFSIKKKVKEYATREHIMIGMLMIIRLSVGKSLPVLKA